MIAAMVAVSTALVISTTVSVGPVATVDVDGENPIATLTLPAPTVVSARPDGPEWVLLKKDACLPRELPAECVAKERAPKRCRKEVSANGVERTVCFKLFCWWRVRYCDELWWRVIDKTAAEWRILPADKARAIDWRKAGLTPE